MDLLGPLVGYALLAVATALLCRVLWRSVPFEPASYAAWAGIFLALLALVALVHPLHWLAMGTRPRAALALGAALAMAAVALGWPSPVRRPSGPRRRIDDFLPEFQFAEVHEIRVRAPLPRVLEAIQNVSWAEMPAAVVLMRLRSLAGGMLETAPTEPEPVFEVMARSGRFLILDASNPAELVMGLAGQPWSSAPSPRLRTPEEFQAFREPGSVRVAFDMRAVEEGDGVVRVSTETRILGNDPAARRTFARYWRLVYPGSAIIRRVWLEAIAARAERAAPPPEARRPREATP